MSEALAIIPARGGSKGIPRKNVLPVAGKPLLAWTVEAARAARRVDRVVVSTDDPEIADVARRRGADVVDRPAEISGDSATSESALLHALDHLRATEGYEPDLVAFLQCTSPLTAPGDIDGTIDALIRDGADTALAVVPFHYFLWRGDGAGINHDKRERKLRQEREPQFLESGAVYVMKVAGFRAAKHRFFGRTALYEMPAIAAGRSTTRSTWRSPRSCSGAVRGANDAPCCPIGSTPWSSTSMASSPTIASPCSAKGGRPSSATEATAWASRCSARTAGRCSCSPRSRTQSSSPAVRS